MATQCFDLNLTTSNSAASSYESNSFTPSANEALCVVVAARDCVLASPTLVSTGGGVTFTLIESAYFAFGSNTHTIYVFASSGQAAASAQTVTFDCTGDAASGCIIHVHAVLNGRQYGSSMFRQKVKVSAQAPSTPTATFGSSCLTENTTLCIVGTYSTAVTPPTNWTEQRDTNLAAPSMTEETATRNSGFTGTQINYGYSDSYQHCVILLEVDSTPIAATVTTTVPTSIGGYRASSGGNVTDDGGGTVSDRGVCWKTSSPPLISDGHVHSGTGTGSFTSLASVLVPLTSYHLRAFVTTEVGTSYGAEYDFTTPIACLEAAVGRQTSWPRALTAAEVIADAAAGQESYDRSLASGTVVISGTVRNRKGAPVPAHHVRAGWWIQNLAWQPDPGAPPPTLYITGHSVDLAGKKNALTIGIDWMEKEIGVRQAELLAIPPTVVPDAIAEDVVDPDTPDTPSEPSTPVKEPGATYQFRGGGTPTGRAGAPAGMEWVSAGEAKEPGGEWISQGEVLRPIGAKWDRNPYD